MTRRPDGWLEAPEIDDTPPLSPHEFRWRTLQELPEDGQQEEEGAVEDAPSVGAASMARGFGGLRGSGSHSGSHSGSELNATFGHSQIQAPAQQ
jgi:hypothetical protein